MQSRFKIFSDPVHGFISVPKGLPLLLVEQPEVQRLRRIRQLGLGHLVFPGAEHSRFVHALGAMALMQEALTTIEQKGTPISADEREAALAVALLHDVGHGPFSHTLEHDLIGPGRRGRFHHEAMSRALIQRIDRRLGGRLALTLEIFDGAYERPFFHQLVASQLDVDRLDYLRRDSFFTGVAEGMVGVARLIKTMRVHPEAGGPGAGLVVEAKGSYAVESFLLSRRVMYWQVYLHKTVIAADHLLRAAFRRAKTCCEMGALEDAGPALRYFLETQPTADTLAGPEREALLDRFCALDDPEVLYSLKRWSEAADRVLAGLSRRFLNRDLFRTALLPREPTAAEVEGWRAQVAAWLRSEGLMPDEAAEAAPLYVQVGSSQLAAYDPRRAPIRILERDGRVRELSEADGVATVDALSGRAHQAYVCYPKQVELALEPAWFGEPTEP